MMASGNIKKKVETDRRKAREENAPSASAASSPNDVKFEMMMKTMERMMDRITVNNKPLNKEHNEPQIRNPNFRRPNPLPLLQNRQRDMREHKIIFEEESEAEQYQRGYLNTIDDFQRNIDLRNRQVIVNKGGVNQNQPSSSQQNTEKAKENKQPAGYFVNPVSVNE